MTPNNDSEQKKSSTTNLKIWRKVEVVAIIFIVIIIAVTTVALVIVRRVNEISLEKCGPSHPVFSVKLSSPVEREDGSYVNEDGTVFPVGAFWKSDGNVFGCPCLNKPCIRKCCATNEVYKLILRNETIGNNNTYSCEPENITSITARLRVFSNKVHSDHQKYELIQIGEQHFYVFHGRPCQEMFMKNPEDYDEDVHYLLHDGRIYQPFTSTYMDQSGYCFEFVGESEYRTFQCVPETPQADTEAEDRWILDVLLVGLLVSVPCLVITFVVYSVLHQKRNIHGRCLMSHVASLIVAYSILALQHHPPSDDEPGRILCYSLAFGMQFSFLSSFFWLNVMCYDIWSVFSAIRMKSLSSAARTRKFLKYSLYAWGGPLIVGAATAFVEFSGSAPDFLVKPEIVVDRCWFRKFDARILYFYLPIGILIVVNVFMFTTTSIRIKQSRDKHLDCSDSQVHNASDASRFSMYLNLFIVMGASWLLEVVSAVVGGPQVYWIIPDLFNSLQGLFIFLIFVCKRRILYQLNIKFCPGLNIVENPSRNFNSSTRTVCSIISNNASGISRKSSASTRC